MKRFLKFGEVGTLDAPTPTGMDYESPFEEAVAAEIARMGFQADAQVGSAGFRIDLAIRHPKKPGRYLMAVECDGAAYHSAAWARERDRLREQILVDHGWRVFRIWSTDWFRQPEKQIARLRESIELAITETDRPRPSHKSRLEPTAVPEITVKVKPAQELPAYREASLTVHSSLEPHLVPVAQMIDVVARIVGEEGPMHQDEVARRVASVFGKERAGQRITSAALKALKAAKRQSLVTADGLFWDVAHRDRAVQPRNRSAASPTIRRADMISPAEITAAIWYVLTESGAVEREQLIVQAARCFGFDRTGPDLKQAISGAIDAMVRAKSVVSSEGSIIPASET